jgi:hypothetical protein
VDYRKNNWTIHRPIDIVIQRGANCGPVSGRPSLGR